MTSALGWQPGDRLTLTAAAGVVIARRDAGSMVTLAYKPYLVIPAALRRRCGLRPGERVLLAVFPDRDAIASQKELLGAARDPEHDLDLAILSQEIGVAAPAEASRVLGDRISTSPSCVGSLCSFARIAAW
jgi:bifunctional DNA-binding transcriptional regulator/antitoxin component of YhaV-PrlF toxin-antitoxin module